MSPLPRRTGQRDLVRTSQWGPGDRLAENRWASMLVIDTAALDQRERIDAVNCAVSTTEVPHLITHTDTGDGVHHRLHLWDIGPGASLIELSGTALRLVRGPRQLQVSGPARVALGIQLGGPAYRSHLGVQEHFAIGDLVMTDLTSAHAHSWSAGSGCRSFNVDYDTVGIGVDVVRRAILNLHHSPLYPLVQAHFTQLCRVADDIPSGPAAALLGSATTELLRALIVTAVDDDPGRDEVLDNTLMLRIRHYVELHLTESTLNAESIAAAHSISVRRVYQVWASGDVSLSQWIMRARLDGARRELARSGQQQTVAAVAKHWAFLDPTHFSRRFRAAYDISPREWQHLHLAAPIAN